MLDSLTRPVLILGGMYAVGVAGLLLRDPYSHTWGACPFLAVTGTECPLCGGLRATYSVYSGDVAAGWASNPLATVIAFLVPVMVAVAVGSVLLRRVRFRPGALKESSATPAERVSETPDLGEAVTAVGTARSSDLRPDGGVRTVE